MKTILPRDKYFNFSLIPVITRVIWCNYPKLLAKIINIILWQQTFESPWLQNSPLDNRYSRVGVVAILWLGREIEMYEVTGRLG